MSDLEKALEQVRAKQKRQIAEYEAQEFFLGTALEIPWEGRLPVRAYTHTPAVRPEGKMKVYINMHGGGFIEGDAKQMSTLCQKLADRLGLFVVNVNYRLSPDYVFPYQCEEIELLRNYLDAHAGELNIDPSHCGIGGFSAGATLALNVVVRALERGEEKYSCCVLGYPMVSADPNENDRECEFQAADDLMMRVIGYYFNGQGATPACSALNAGDELLSRFPGVVEITCGADSLGPQGKKFAARLVANGVRTNYIEFKRARHGFIEVNRPDYLPDDPRKTPDQAALNVEGEEFIIDGLASML